MTAYEMLDEARHRLDEIFDYTYDRWGEAQAVRYVDELIDRLEAIASRSIPWRRIPAQFGVDGYVCRCERHFIYWKVLESGRVGIVTILHERMQQSDLLHEAFEQ